VLDDPKEIIVIHDDNDDANVTELDHAAEPGNDPEPGNDAELDHATELDHAAEPGNDAEPRNDAELDHATKLNHATELDHAAEPGNDAEPRNDAELDHATELDHAAEPDHAAELCIETVTAASTSKNSIKAVSYYTVNSIYFRSIKNDEYKLNLAIFEDIKNLTRIQNNIKKLKEEIEVQNQEFILHIQAIQSKIIFESYLYVKIKLKNTT
jgi:hypothetical protein